MNPDYDLHLKHNSLIVYTIFDNRCINKFPPVFEHADEHYNVGE